MKTTDVEYYSDQINFFTPCRAIERKNYITVIFSDGKRKAAHMEYEASQLWKKCNNTRP